MMKLINHWRWLAWYVIVWAPFQPVLPVSAVTGFTFYARASASLPVGTVFSPANVKVVRVPTDDMPTDCLWLASPNDIYGFTSLQKCGKNQLITGADLFHGGNKFAITATDPLWLKYAKSAIICDQQHDFPTSHRYADGAIAELEKMAKQGQHVRDADSVMVARQMISHTEESQMNAEDAQNAQLNQAARFQLQNITTKNVDAMKQKLAQEWKDKKAQDAEDANEKARERSAINHALVVFTQVFPPNCQTIIWTKRLIGP